MRFGDERESTNFDDVTGRSGGFGGGGFGGGGLGCLLPLVASRFGIGGVVVLVIGYFILSSLGGLNGGGGGVAPVSQQAAQSGQSNLDPRIKHFSLQVLASTEDVWTNLLAKKGIQYTPTRLEFYSGSYGSGCGAAQSAMGPFYCPTDKKIYLDTEFFGELSQRFQAPGDFAMAYVIAHEVAKANVAAKPATTRTSTATPTIQGQRGRDSSSSRCARSMRNCCRRSSPDRSSLT